MPAAADEAARGAERCRNDASRVWYWKLRLLQAEALSSQDRGADAAKLLAEPVPDGPEYHQLRVRHLIDRADVSGSREAAAPLLQQAANQVTDGELAVRIPLTEGVVALEKQKFAEAQGALIKAHEMAGAYPYRDASALSNLCYSYKAQNLLEKSIEAGRLALTAAEKSGARRLAAAAHGNLGSTYALLGDFDSAFVHQSEAVRMFESMGARLNLERALGELGLLFDLQDDPDKAVPYYKRAFQIASELPNGGRDVVRFAENLSNVLIKAENWDAAVEWNQRAAELSAAAGSKDVVPFRERNRARIEYGRGNYDEAARICQELLDKNPESASIRWATYNLLGVIDARKGRTKKAAADFETALQIIDSTRSDLLNQHYRITLLSRLIPFYDEYIDFLVEQNDNAGALRVLESSRARVLAERLGNAAKFERFRDLPSVERFAKSANVSLLSFQLAPQRSFVWLIAPDGTHRFPLKSASDIEKLVTEYRTLVEHSLWDPLTAKKPQVTDLWTALLSEAAPFIPKGSRVIVIPDGVLHRLNLETLVAPSPSPHYWIEDVELAVAPSLAIAMSKPEGAAAERGSALLMGAADYSGTGYEPLKGAEREIRDIQQRFAAASPAVYTGARATPAAYREANPGRFALIHFAAHAEANAEKPLESAVVLTHDKLFARDVIGIPIRADLVTLSACHSAGSRTYGGEGLMGFTWAFLNAGARAVVAGLWDASDDSTAPLMDRFYAGIAEGQKPAAALRNAKLAMLKNDPRYRKPFYWGPFQVYLGSAD